jgi:glutamine synthetase
MNTVVSLPAFSRPTFVDDARRVFQALQRSLPEIREVDAMVVDINGILRGKRLPVADADRLFESGMQIPRSIYLMDPRGEMTNPFGRGIGDGDPDGTAWPLPQSVGPVWCEGTPRAQMLMTMRDETGAWHPAESRSVLEHVAARFNRSGLAPVAAMELEFYLIDLERGPLGEPQPPRDPANGVRESAHAVYEASGLDRHAEFLRALNKAASFQGLPLSATSCEYGPGQFEANLRHQSDPCVAADQAIYLKQIVKMAARSAGYDATFMPKPYPARAGSGLHVHVSVLDSEGRNIFDDGSNSGSEALRHAIGGLQAAMPQSMAIFAPSVNSYRRFQADMFAPVNRRWGVNNRSVGLRVPVGPGDARRLEHRAAGADANPYLVLAAVLAGMHHGIENRTDPGAPADGNVSHAFDPELPLTIDEALARMGQAQVLCDYLGEETVALYRESKRLELQRFRSIVSPAEFEWYL